MVMPVPIQSNPVQNGIVILTGGINESVTNLELKEGELLDCVNYEEIDGPYHGYTSTRGYEVFDGTQSPSSVEIIIDPDTEEVDDTAREARRDAITPVPGQNPIRGVHTYEGEIYACRDAAVDPKDIHVATDTGWSSISPPSDMVAGGQCAWVNAIFPAYPAGDFVGTRSMFMVDGVSRPIGYNKLSNVCEYIDDINLPSNQTGIGLPQYPTHIAAFDNRAWMAFPNGKLFYSELGVPNAWDETNGAGQIPCGDEITDLIVAPGNVLVVFMRNSTKIVYIAESSTVDFIYQLKEFSQRSGCLPGASDRLLGDVYYIDDRGPTTMQAADQFGDFDASSLTKKIQRTFLEYKSKFTCSAVVRSLNQWRLFFEDGFGMCFAFHAGRLKGATFFKYAIAPTCATEGEDVDGNIRVFLGASDGYVYQIDSGTSFNGADIPTLMVTSYYHYRTPRRTKRFLRLVFEMSADKGTKFYVRSDYDYKAAESAKNAEGLLDITGFGGIWGIDTWSEFIWGSAYVQNPTLYIQGYGFNMAMIMRTAEKYKSAHVVHNFIADYHTLDQRM